jgi:hypothetical protein
VSNKKFSAWLKSSEVKTHWHAAHICLKSAKMNLMMGWCVDYIPLGSQDGEVCSKQGIGTFVGTGREDVGFCTGTLRVGPSDTIPVPADTVPM